MNFELTISGLCVIALKSNQNSPEHPEAIDIIVPDADHHTCRLSWVPGEVLPGADNKEEPDLVVDSTGARMASLLLNKRALSFELKNNPATQFTVHWGPDPTVEKPEAPFQETWLNWIPQPKDLGFEKPFEVGDPGHLPTKASARITLPFGALASRKVVTERDTNEYILWTFPANKNVKRVLTNEVAFTADHVETLEIKEGDKVIWTATRGSTDTLRMCISNDMASVPKDFADGSKALDHLSHVDVLFPVDEKNVFVAPQLFNVQEHTGHPICMGVVFVHPGA